MKESKQNKDRVTSLYPFTGRSVDNLNAVNPYQKEFNANNSSVSLDIDIKDAPSYCTASPPDQESWCTYPLTATWIKDEPCPMSYAGCCEDECCPGYILEGFMRYPVLYNGPDAPDQQVGGWTFQHMYFPGGVRLAGTFIVFPEDGCYAVRVQNTCYGWDYFEYGYTGIDLVMMGSDSYAIGHEDRQRTGYLGIMGPVLWYTPAPADIYTIVTARAGAKMAVAMTATSYGVCKGWVAGAYLRGFFSPGTTTVNIRLVARSENVPQYPLDTPLDYEEGTVVDSDAARLTFNRVSNAQVKVV